MESSAWPEPREGRAAISCSKSFCKEEYGQFIAWASVNLPPEDFEKLPAWREVKDWPGKVVGVCDYKARERMGRESWDEGYQYWWDLSNVVRLPEPIPCRGNVGMWALPPSIAQSVLEQVHSLQTVKSVEANAAQRRPICKPVLVSLGHLPGTAAIELGEVFRTAFKVNADAIIVAHNHPSGDPTPSKADLQLTAALQSAANLLGVKFLDHLVLGAPDYEGGKGYMSVVEQM